MLNAVAIEDRVVNLFDVIEWSTLRRRQRRRCRRRSHGTFGATNGYLLLGFASSSSTSSFQYGATSLDDERLLKALLSGRHGRLALLARVLVVRQTRHLDEGGGALLLFHRHATIAAACLGGEHGCRGRLLDLFLAREAVYVPDNESAVERGGEQTLADDLQAVDGARVALELALELARLGVKAAHDFVAAAGVHHAVVLDEHGHAVQVLLVDARALAELQRPAASRVVRARRVQQASLYLQNTHTHTHKCNTQKNNVYVHLKCTLDITKAYHNGEDHVGVAGECAKQLAGLDLPRLDRVVCRAAEEEILLVVDGETSDGARVRLERVEALARLDGPRLGERVERAGEQDVLVQEVLVAVVLLVDARRLLALLLGQGARLDVVGRLVEQRRDVVLVAGKGAQHFAVLGVPAGDRLVVRRGVEAIVDAYDLGHGVLVALEHHETLAQRHVPLAHGVVATRAKQDVLAYHNRAHVAFVAGHEADALDHARRRTPQADDAVVAAGGQQCAILVALEAVDARRVLLARLYEMALVVLQLLLHLLQIGVRWRYLVSHYPHKKLPFSRAQHLRHQLRK